MARARKATTVSAPSPPRSARGGRTAGRELAEGLRRPREGPTTAPGHAATFVIGRAAAARRRRAVLHHGTRRALVLVEAVAPATADE